MTTLAAATILVVANVVLVLAWLGHRAEERDTRRRQTATQLALVEGHARRAHMTRRLASNGLR